MSIADKYTTLTTEKIPNVYESGKTAEYERFWSNFLNEGQRANFDYGFCGSGWNENNLKIPSKYLPLLATAAQYMFRGCTATVIPSVNFENCVTLNQTYAYARNVATIGTVIFKSDGTNVLTNPFNYCDELENISFEGVIGASVSFGRSPKLSSESIDNIIEHLKDLTGATAQTITFHTTTVGNMTEEQMNAIFNKNWDVG